MTIDFMASVMLLFIFVGVIGGAIGLLFGVFPALVFFTVGIILGGSYLALFT